MNEFFHRLHPSDRVLLVGDTRQHEAVEAGRPYKQLQDAGMQTAKLDEILRQKDPTLKEAVEQARPRRRSWSNCKTSNSRAVYMRSLIPKNGSAQLPESMHDSQREHS